MKKGDHTKQSILADARELFIEKGYSAVTMTDLCEKTKLSRGGLYRHFSSTREIFLQLLETEKETAEMELEQAIKDSISPTALIHKMLADQKKLILSGGGELVFAIHEFSKKERLGKEYLRERDVAATAMVERLVRYGQEKGIFRAENSEQMSVFIVQFFNGLQLSATSLGFTENELEEKLQIIFDYLVKQEERK